ncbi:MAG: ribonuclease HII [Candidatus Edwardsbacteria bacterium]|nr:ribonuclease HII [Candidatus Edwardsbacteria bacterium]
MASRSQGNKLYLFDSSYRRQGYKLIAGVDEAGRGPLAGPVVAAAVILRAKAALPGIDDSKKLSPKQRERAFKLVLESSLAVGLGIVAPEEIDRINILQASLKAMNYALCGLNLRPDLVLIDGNRIPRGLPKGLKPQEARAVIAGDSLSLSIASASIIAKCLRDSLMRAHHNDFPGYGFDRHKGYGTRYHIAALNRYGPCAIHRKSFEPVKSLLGA